MFRFSQSCALQSFKRKKKKKSSFTPDVLLSLPLALQEEENLLDLVTAQLSVVNQHPDLPKQALHLLKSFHLLIPPIEACSLGVSVFYVWGTVKLNTDSRVGCFHDPACEPVKMTWIRHFRFNEIKSWQKYIECELGAYFVILILSFVGCYLKKKMQSQMLTNTTSHRSTLFLCYIMALACKF